MREFEEALKVLSVYSLYHVPVLISEKGELSGLCIADKRIILISEDNLPRTIEKTVLHELTHAYDFMMSGTSNERDVEKRTNDIYMRLVGKYVD